MYLTHLRISHSLQVEKIPKRFPCTQKNINWVIDYMQSCKWALHLHILWNFWRNCVNIPWSSTKKIHTTLSVVEQLHSDVPAFCNSIPNLLYCALISIRSLQKPDAESHQGHDANQSPAIIIFRPNNLFQHEAVFSESILPGQGNSFNNNNQFQSLK